MKRNFFLFASLFIAILISLSSCKKEEATTVVIDESQTASIKGIVYADLDNTNGSYEYAPSGTKMIIKVANSEYLKGTEGYKTFETTVGSDGQYSFNVPANNTGVQVKVMLVDFTYNQKISSTETERKIYKVSSWDPFLVKGDVKVNDFYYSN